MQSPDELKALVDEALEQLDLWPELHGQADVRALRARGRRQAGAARDRARGRGGARRSGRAGDAGSARDRARPHVLARPRRPARDGRRRGAPRPPLDVEEVRRGRRRPRRRRAARGGVPARGALRVVGGRARARRGDARHDRRPVPRHDGRGLRPRRRAPAQDGTALLRLGDDGALGGRAARGGAGAVACVRRGARAPVPDRRRHPRRRRLRARARRRRRPPLRRRGRRAGAREARRGSTRTRPSCATSSTGSPCARHERSRRDERGRVGQAQLAPARDPRRGAVRDGARLERDERLDLADRRRPATRRFRACRRRSRCTRS